MTRAEHDRMMAYRTVFSGEKGAVVLTDMLISLHYFDEVMDQQEVELRNYAVKLLTTMGYLEPENLRELVKRMASLPVVDRKIEDTGEEE